MASSNFACPASPSHSQQDPHATFTTSVLGAQRLIEMARGGRCSIVHASASEVYGDPTVHPQPESYGGNVNPIGPRACHDEGKRGAETLLGDARRCWGVDARIVRIFDTYGPRMAIRRRQAVALVLSRRRFDRGLHAGRRGCRRSMARSTWATPTG